MNRDNLDRLIEIVNTDFEFNKYVFSGILEEDIMFKSIDGLAISYNIQTELINIWDSGYSLGFISKHNIEAGLVKISPEVYELLLTNIYNSLYKESGLIPTLRMRLKDLEDKEQYEFADKLHQLIQKINPTYEV